jgi:dTMP kinase
MAVNRQHRRIESAEVLKNFIVIEGLDGAGTTTQLSLIDQRLGDVGVLHCCTFEPTNGAIGRLIREILAKALPVRPRTLALLFAADRTEHVESSGIRSHLEGGEIVVCDRYLFSSLAYQSIDCGFDFVLSINEGFPLPELLIFIDTPPDLCRQRRQNRSQSDLFDSVPVQEEVRHRYEQAIDVFRHTSMNVRRIDGKPRAEEISENIWNIMRELSIIKS